MRAFATTTRNIAFTAFTRAHCAMGRLTAWAEAGLDPEADEHGSYSTELVVVISTIVLLAITILAIIVKKTVDKANSISF